MTDDNLGPAYLRRREDAEVDAVIDRALTALEEPKPDAFADKVADSEVMQGGPLQQVVGGVRDAVQETSDFLFDATEPIARELESLFPLGSVQVDENGVSLVEGFGEGRPELPEVPPPETTAGSITRGVSQFLTGFIPAAKIAKVGKAATTGGKIGRAMAAGAATDAVVFDPDDPNLANLVQEHPELANPVAELLATDPDDSDALNRFRRSVEGVVVGAPLEGLVVVLKGMRARKAAVKAETAVEERTTAILGDPNARLLPADTDAAIDSFLSGRLQEIPDTAANINMARIGGPEDVREVIAATAQRFGGRLGSQSLDQTAALADEIAVDPARVRELLGRDGAFKAEEITALRFLLHSSGGELQRLGKKVVEAGATEADMFAFQRQMAFHNALLGQVTRGARETGRALGAFRITAEGATEQVQAIRQMLQQQGGSKEFTQLAADLLQSMETPAQMNAFVRDASRATTTDMLLEAWINGLLSNPTTHMVNMTSNAVVALMQIPERFLAAQIGRALGDQAIPTGEAVAQAWGLVRGTKDGLGAFARTFRSGVPEDVLGKIETRAHRAISSQNLGLEETSLPGYAVDLLGTLARVPGRFLTSEDAFFKAVGYRMELHAQAYRMASEEGLTGRAFSQRLQDIVANPPENVRLAAQDAARIQTFTNALGPAGTFMQMAMVRAPVSKLVMPFFRTPVNIMKFVGMRSPLAPLARSFREDIRAGGARRDLALARMGLGSLIMAVASEMSAEGHITGGGPADPGLRAALRRTGWQPYSVRIGDTYYAYNRLDPVGATIGIAADISEIIGQTEDADTQEMAAAAVLAVSKNIVSKTYLSGLSDVLSIFDEGIPELGAARGEHYINRLVGSVVPAGVAQLERVTDPTIRVADDMVQAIRARVPGFSDDLPPLRNLWGEPILLGGGLGPDMISPIYTSEKVESPIDAEIVRNRVSIRMPGRVVKDVELTPKEYDRYVVLAAGEAKNPVTGLGARETLDELVQSEQYRQATDGPEGLKALLIREHIQAFRALATEQLVTEFPDLRRRIERRAIEKATALTGAR